MTMFKSEEKTGYSQAAASAVITSGVLGVMPFFNVDISVQQATNLGLFCGAVIGLVVRKFYKLHKK